MQKPSAEQIDALLPQTQCGDCGYGGCLPYAKAMANGEADINLCPPGGTRTLKRLANLLGKNPDHYTLTSKPLQAAIIREELCIGCTKCIQACPVDAIVGAMKKMHTVIQSECTGCNLCVEPCPMDCIDMIDVTQLTDRQADAKATLTRKRFQAHNARLALEHTEKTKQHQAAKLTKDDIKTSIKAKQAAIKAAVERTKAKRSANEPKKTS